MSPMPKSPRIFSLTRGKQTPIDPTERKTGKGTSQDTRSGAEPEAPRAKNADTPGDPNQGTEAR